MPKPRAKAGDKMLSQFAMEDEEEEEEEDE